MQLFTLKMVFALQNPLLELSYAIVTHNNYYSSDTNNYPIGKNPSKSAKLHQINRLRATLEEYLTRPRLNIQGYRAKFCFWLLISDS
jgi:hypothetical protein